ncbi:hypothetical protein LC608_30670 [Nostoc sp. XA010]|uniref:hypothetical protein n=1 Tax=Nostoc sp. XA010 TaxID=2780407 RepID=UPI001E360BAD|nr:hypothetical protein [Nostoc sp. XA010]MCC5661250.1 hypothetical protein [Nostoc sp. XA010]
MTSSKVEKTRKQNRTKDEHEQTFGSLEHRFSIHSYDKKLGLFGLQQGKFGFKGVKIGCLSLVFYY